MSSFRVYEIARQLNISSDEVIKMGKELGLDLKSHSSVLTQTQLEEIADVYNKITAETQTNKNTAISSTAKDPGPSGAYGNVKPVPVKTLNREAQKKVVLKAGTQWKPVPKRGESVKEALDKVALKEEEIKLAAPEEVAPKSVTFKEKVSKAVSAKVKTFKEKAPIAQLVKEKISKKQEILKIDTLVKDNAGEKSKEKQPQTDLQAKSEQLKKEALKKPGGEKSPGASLKEEIHETKKQALKTAQEEAEAKKQEFIKAGELKKQALKTAADEDNKQELKKAEAAAKDKVIAEAKKREADKEEIKKEVTFREVESKEKPPVSTRPKYQWDEEKKFNIRKVLDKELDKEEKEGRFKPSVKASPARKAAAKKDESKGKLQVSEDGSSMTAPVEKPAKRTEIKKNIEFPEGITIKQLSEKINVASGEILQSLFDMGDMININQPLDKDIIEILSQEYNFKYSIIGFEDNLDEGFNDSEESLVIRSPIVTVMGHVDHGKTTLLDAIRKENVVSSEAGGITQSIGAYQTVFNNRKITFIDTPGHEAFTTMRARGAKVTDIAVIVIAADDGIMPQTIEAINHAKQARVPIIVAVNKIDLPNANQERVKQGLTEYGLVPEEWGGDTIFVSISAKNKINIEGLLEMILLVADMNEIKGNPGAEGIGIIIESKLDKNFGPIGTVLVKRGSIKVGDFFITGNSFGRVRNIKNEYGKNITKGELSQPVEISGFTTITQAGDKIFIVKNEKAAKDLTSKRENQKKQSRLSEEKKHVTLEDLADLSKENEIKKLKIILKSESNGSLDAVEKSLKDAEEENVKIDIIHKGVGAITDSDILLASASNAIVMGFGVVANAKAKLLSKEEKIEIRTYDIIYKLIDDIKLAFKGMLEPKYEEKIKGNIEIREVFKVTKMGNVAGCYVLDGEAERGDSVRIIRDGKVIYASKIDTLHRFKDDVKKVNAGYECGIRIENYQDVSKGDIFEVYEQKEVKQ